MEVVHLQLLRCRRCRRLELRLHSSDSAAPLRRLSLPLRFRLPYRLNAHLGRNPHRLRLLLRSRRQLTARLLQLLLQPLHLRPEIVFEVARRSGRCGVRLGRCGELRLQLLRPGGKMASPPLKNVRMVR